MVKVGLMGSVFLEGEYMKMKEGCQEDLSEIAIDKNLLGDGGTYMESAVVCQYKNAPDSLLS